MSEEDPTSASYPRYIAEEMVRLGILLLLSKTHVLETASTELR